MVLGVARVAPVGLVPNDRPMYCSAQVLKGTYSTLSSRLSVAVPDWVPCASKDYDEVEWDNPTLPICDYRLESKL